MYGIGELVVLYGGYGDTYQFVLKKGEKHVCRLGTFGHSSMIDKLTFGSIIRDTKTTKWMMILRPSPEAYSLTLSHRTQIVYFKDAAFCCQLLNLRDGAIVVESGTGSCSMTYFMSRIIGDGTIFTFEYHDERVVQAANELAKLGLKNVKLYHRDVYKYGFEVGVNDQEIKIEETKFLSVMTENLKLNNETILNDVMDDNTSIMETTNIKDASGIMETTNISKSVQLLPPESADAVFLDLPEPWYSLDHAQHILKSGVGNLVVFSPCVEQVHQTVDWLDAKCWIYSIYEVSSCMSKFRVYGSGRMTFHDDKHDKYDNKETENVYLRNRKVCPTTRYGQLTKLNRDIPGSHVWPVEQPSVGHSSFLIHAVKPVE